MDPRPDPAAATAASPPRLTTRRSDPVARPPAAPPDRALPLRLPAQRLSAALFAAVPPLLYIWAALTRFAPAWTAPTSRAICGCGDAAFTMWFIRWTPFALGHGRSPFFTTWLNVPDGVNAMWNVNFFLPSLLVSPVTALGGPVLAYNVLSTAAFALSGYSAYLVFRRWAPWPPAAFAGGALFGFSPFMTAQGLGHLHMTLAFLLPLFLLVFDQLLVRQRGGWLLWGALLGVLAAAQLLTSEEMFASSVLVGLAAMLILLALNPRRIRPRAGYALRGLGSALVVFVVLTAWPLHVQFYGGQRLAGPVQQLERFSADLVAPLVPSWLMRFAPERLVEISSHFSGNTAENGAYLGLPLVAVLVVTVLCVRSAVVRFAAVATLATFVLSLGRHLHVAGHLTGIALPLALLRHVPLLQSVVASRLSLHVTLFAALLLAMALDKLYAVIARVGRAPAADTSAAVGSRPSQLRPVLAAAVPVAVAVAVLLPLLPAHPYAGRPVDVPQWFESGSVQRVPKDSVLLTIPLPSRADSRPMLWQAVAGMRYRSPGGYILVPDARGRPQWGTPSVTAGRLNSIRIGHRLPPLDPFQLHQLRSELGRWQVRTVVIPIDGMTRWADAIALYAKVLGRPPVRDHNAYVWYDVDPATLR